MHSSGTRASASEILIHLDRTARIPLRAQLEQSLRELIRSGTLDAGASLPSSRVLAADLDVSRRLVVEAYQQLVAEGYLSTRERSVTRVESVGGGGETAVSDDPAPARYDLRPSVPALAEFPRTAWSKAMTSAIKGASDAALGYPDPHGSIALRRTVASYLRRVRAVAVEPDRVVICAGFTQALSLLTVALGRPTIALENPGLIGRDRTIAAAGGHHVSVPVDHLGLRTDLLTDTPASAVVTTPAHQFPLGVALAASRRTRLLDWARQDRLIIEDDYDAEFRYDRQPVGAVQGLAPEHVAYVGTVSKTLAPALRLGWLVLPSALLAPLIEIKRSQDAGSPTLDQLALAELIDSGAYERHLRRVRRLYRERRDLLLAALDRYLPSARVNGMAAGLHLLIRVPPDVDVAEIVTAAASHDLAITGIDRYTLTHIPHQRSLIVLGYANLAPSAIPEATRRLAAAVTAHSG